MAELIDISITGTHVVPSHSLFGQAYTVTVKQEYEVESRVDGRRVLVNRRYREFKKLHKQVSHT